MSTRTLAVVSAGLGVPSSTRLLADRLTSATVAALHGRGVEVKPCSGVRKRPSQSTTSSRHSRRSRA